MVLILSQSLTLEGFTNVGTASSVMFISRRLSGKGKGKVCCRIPDRHLMKDFSMR